MKLAVCYDTLIDIVIGQCSVAPSIKIQVSFAL
jgi:hypothetical protein